KRMKQNAAGGLACYGHELADSVPTVLVGVPEHKRILRDYTSDNQQPFKDSYAHVIGALAGIKHFIAANDSENSIREGLYGVSASDASLLTGDLIARESDEASLKTMVGHAQILVCLLKVYSKLLRTTSERNLSKDKSSVFNFFNFAGDTPFPSIAYWAYRQLGHDTASLKYAANELDLIIENYEEILEWIKSLGAETSADLYYETRDVDSKSKNFFCEERQCLKRLQKHQLPDIKELRKSRLSNLKDAEIVALSLFHWVADWITDDWEKANLPTKKNDAPHGQGYWPDVRSKDDAGLVPNWNKPGELGKVQDGKVITCIQNHFDSDDVSPNSWPHPFAITEQFKFQIAKEDPIALRKLEILLVGRALGILEFKKVEYTDTKRGLSLERLIKDEAIAKYRLIHKGSDKIYGFNSPSTLLCPAPDVDDNDWVALRKDIIKSDWVDWKNFESLEEGIKKAGKYVSHHLRGTASKIKEKLMSGDEEKFSWAVSAEWGSDGERARQAIKGWISCTKKYIKATVDKRSRTWFDVFDVYLKTESGPFGIAEWLPLPSEDVRMPIPILGPSTNIFEEGVPDKEEAEKRYPNFQDSVPEFTSYSADPDSEGSEVFKLINDFHIPGLELPMKAIWREHLDGLQTLGKIFAWEIDHAERGVWIMQELGDSPVYIRDLVVIDKDVIQIETCIPLEQKRINESRTKEIKYPDIPLRPEFIDLLKVPEGQKNAGDRCLDHDDAWKALQQSGTPDSGRKLVRWTLDLRGRSKSLPITVSVEGVEVSKAHWMIWPNFKSDYNPDQSNDLWRAYYVFEHCDKTSLEIQTIYMAHERQNPLQITKSPQGCPGHAYALSFEDGHHSGGPPLAFSAYDEKFKDTGIYIIGLTKRSHDQQPWKLAIDFGTSHSVAAYQIGNNSETVHLDAELASGDGLTLHVSENHDVEDTSEMGFDLWRPTYLKKNVDNIAKSMLPSDLWSVEEIESVDVGKFQSEWSPMTHYSIPVIQLQRSNIRDHIISGFKWDLTDGKFRNQEQWLRERYLRMAI
ncbi:MAG: hypothetical protein OXF06_06695, partial [Bacteroidetes bacterium]|nr:hypothetical protein [Bacteroidota bacterium]